MPRLSSTSAITQHDSSSQATQHSSSSESTTSSSRVVRVGFFANDNLATCTHWLLHYDFAEALLRASPQTIAVFYFCGASAEKKLSELRQKMNDVVGVEHRIQNSAPYCDALGGELAVSAWWGMLNYRASNSPNFFSPKFGEMITTEANKLDAVVADKIFGAWAKVGLARRYETLDPAVFANDPKPPAWFGKLRSMPVVDMWPFAFGVPNIAEVSEPRRKRMKLEMPTGWDFYLHSQPPGLTPKETRFYEALPGVRSETVASVSLFSKQKVSHLSDSGTSSACGNLPAFLTDKKMADGRTCKRVVFVGLGTRFYDQNSIAQQEALSDQLLRLAAKFPEVCFLWNAEPGFVRGRASFLALPHSDSDAFPLANMEVRSCFPQKQILSSPQLHAFVSHGGLNSVNEALARGVPPLVIVNRQNPDAPIAAEMLAERGWGLNLETVLGTHPHALKNNAGWTCVEGHWLGMEPASSVTPASQYATEFPSLEKFFSDFIVNDGAESVSGKGYTLAQLRKTLDHDVFGGGAGVPAGEEQLTHMGAVNKLLAAIGKEPPRPTVPDDVWPPVGGGPLEKDGGGPSTAVVVALVSGGLVLLVAVALGVWCLCRRVTRSSEEEDGETEQELSEEQ